MMANIRGKNTQPELLIRKGLHARGFRYRLHDARLPGKPDIVFPKYGAVIFVNGCFWHRHDCDLFRWPSTRPEFWKEKIEGNRRRDLQSIADLESLGWRVLTVWECAVKGKNKITPELLLAEIAMWIEEGMTSDSIGGIDIDQHCGVDRRILESGLRVACKTPFCE